MPLKLTERDLETLDHVVGWQLESGTPMTTEHLGSLLGVKRQQARNRILILANKGCLEVDDPTRRWFHCLRNLQRDTCGRFIPTERGLRLRRAANEPEGT